MSAKEDLTLRFRKTPHAFCIICGREAAELFKFWAV
jgi:hypothetical protein